MKNHVSPFLNSEYLLSEPPEPVRNLAPTAAMEASSPFMAEFEAFAGEDSIDVKKAEQEELINELFDEEFEDALEDLAHQAYQFRESTITSSHNSGNNRYAEQLIQAEFSPLLNEVDRLHDHYVDMAEKYDAGELDEIGFESLLEQYEPIFMQESPQYDYFFKRIRKAVGKVAKKAKKAVKKAVSFAKKIGLGPILRRLKGIVKKFLKGFLNRAMRKIPRSLRPLAEKLRKRYLKMETPAMEEEGPLQEELNFAVAELLTAKSQAEMDHNMELFMQEMDEPVEESEEEVLERAREQLVQNLSELEEGGDPEPAVEQFVSAVMIGLKWAIRIIGKKRVKKFLVRILSGIARRYIGSANARRLSSFIVDQGFKLLRLELSEGELMNMNHEVVALTLQETLLDVAQLPDHILENESLLEGYTIEAFEKAARTNLPDMLSERVYRKHPRLRESAKHKLMWQARRKRNGRMARYKKMNKEMEVELSPLLMDEIKTHKGLSLSQYLRDSMGVDVNDTVVAKAHLFELMPGGNLMEIAEEEAMIGGASRLGKYQLHPLTSTAAGLLFGEPNVSCKAKGKCLSAGRRGKRGHRYYYLQIKQKMPQMYKLTDGTMALRKPSFTRLQFHFPGSVIKLTQFLSEADSQSINTLLRNGQQGRGLAMANLILAQGIERSFRFPENGQLMMVHPLVLPGPRSAYALNFIPAALQKAIKERLIESTQQALAEYLQLNGGDFDREIGREEDGVSLSFEISANDIMTEMAKYLVATPDVLLSKQSPTVALKVQADVSLES
ncbi:MAG: hypothetical protein AAF927_08685 [Bacteroidota bacterium]